MRYMSESIVANSRFAPATSHRIESKIVFIDIFLSRYFISSPGRSSAIGERAWTGMEPLPSPVAGDRLGNIFVPVICKD
mgnify:FL=1